MAELTPLDEKLAEVLGLAQAAQTTTQKVAGLARDEGEDDLVSLMERMTTESEQTEASCQKVADTREGMKTAIADKARETKLEVTGFMKTYLEDAEALDGLEFLSMSEAGEVIHLEILGTLNETAKDVDVASLVDSITPMQQGHVTKVREHALALAADEDPEQAG